MTPTILAMSPTDGDEADEGPLTRGTVLSRSMTVNSTEDFDDFYDAEGGTMDEEDFERLERMRQNSQGSVQVSEKCVCTPTISTSNLFLPPYPPSLSALLIRPSSSLPPPRSGT